MVRRDGCEPMGLGAGLGALVTEWAWELPAAGASLRERWAAIAPDLGTPEPAWGVPMHLISCDGPMGSDSGLPVARGAPVGCETPQGPHTGNRRNATRGAAISLTTVQQTAPGLVSYCKAARISLEKAGLADQRVALCVLADRSRSVGKFFAMDRSPGRELSFDRQAN